MTDEQRIGDLYNSFMDAEAVERRGGSRCRGTGGGRGRGRPGARGRVLGGLQRTGVGGGVGVYIDTDDKNSSAIW